MSRTDSRRGRKRRWRGQKLPGTQPDIMERAPDDRLRASLQPHRRNLPPDLRLDERAGTALGQLLLTGFLNDTAARIGVSGIGEEAAIRYQAGMLFAQIAGEYRSVIEAPRSVSGSGRGLLCEVNYCWDNGDTCTCYRRKIRYQNAYFALARAGRAAALAVQRLVVFGEPIGVAGIVYLKEGLDRLAEYFCLTARTERGHVKKYKIKSYA
jgi:hypothetical protein